MKIPEIFSKSIKTDEVHIDILKATPDTAPDEKVIHFKSGGKDEFTRINELEAKWQAEMNGDCGGEPGALKDLRNTKVWAAKMPTFADFSSGQSLAPDR